MPTGFSADIYKSDNFKNYYIKVTNEDITGIERFIVYEECTWYKWDGKTYTQFLTQKKETDSNGNIVKVLPRNKEYVERLGTLYIGTKNDDDTYTYTLAKDNGFNENYRYYYITYVPVDVSSDTEAKSDEGNKEYVLYTRNTNGTYSKATETTGAGCKANVQYYQKIYKYVALSRDDYKYNGRYYYLETDKEGKIAGNDKYPATEYLVDSG